MTTSAPDTSTYILVNADATDLPNSRVLVGGTDIALQDSGPSHTLTIEPVGALGNLAALNQTGYITFNTLGQAISSNYMSGSASINITNGDGLGGATTFSVVPDSTIQQIQISNGGVLIATRPAINFIGTNGVSISVADDPGEPPYGVANVTISGNGSAGTGTVTSVGLTSSTSVLTVTGTSPITTSGSFALAITPGTDGQVLTTSGSSVIWGNGGGGGGVTSVTQASGDTSIVISPTSGAVTLALNTTLSKNYTFTGSNTFTQSINIDNNAMLDVQSIQWFAGGQSPQLYLFQNPTSESPNTNCLALSNLGWNQGDLGLVYDSLYNPLGGFAGTAGQFLKLVTPANAGTKTPQVLQWADASGSGGLIGAVSGSGASINIVGGNSTVPLAASGGGQLVISGQTPAWANTNNGGNVVVGAGGAGMGNGTTPTYTYSTIIGSGAGTYLNEGYNAINIGNATYGMALQQSSIMIGDGLFAGSGDSISTGSICIGTGYAVSIAADMENCILLGGGGPNGTAVSLVPDGSGNIFGRIAIGYLANPTNNATAVIGNNANAGSGGQPNSFKIGIAQNTPLGTLHLGNTTAANDATSIFFDGNSAAHSISWNNIPANGMAIWVGPTGLPFITAKGAPANVQPTQIPMLNRDGTLPGGSVVQAGDMMVGSVNTTAFSVVNIGSNPVGSVWKITNTGASATCGWGTTSLSTSEPVFSSVAPVSPEQSVSYIAYADPDDINSPTDFELPVDFTIGSSFRVIGLNKWGWIISTALGSGVTQKIVYNNQLVYGDNDHLSGIQCNPADAPSASGFLGTTVELVYAKLEDDGSQVWTVMYTQGVIDLFQG